MRVLRLSCVIFFALLVLVSPKSLNTPTVKRRSRLTFLWGRVRAHVATVFIKVSVDHVAVSIVNRPMPAIGCQHLLCSGLS